MKKSADLLFCLVAVLSPLAGALSPVFVATDYGPFTSVDGGFTWKELTLPGSDQAIQTIMVNPVTPSTLYAWGSTQFFKSTDAGQTWTGFTKTTYIRGSGPNTFAIDPVSTNVFYTYTDLNGVVKSSDSGVTWSTLTIPKPPGSGAGPTPLQPGLINVFTDPMISGVVYVIGPNDDSMAGLGFLLKSGDFGSTWSILAKGLDFGGGIAIDPKNSQTIYGYNKRVAYGTCPPVPALATPAPGADCALYKSTDGGQTWAPMGLASSTLSNLAFDATPGVLYAAATPLLIQPAVFTSNDAGTTWTNILQGGVVNSISYVRADPGTPSQIYSIGTSLKTISRSPDGGAHWATVQLTPVCYGKLPSCSQFANIYDIAVAASAVAPPPAPTISANGVFNAAGYQPGVVANSWVTIQGTNFATVTGDWSNAVVNGNLPTTLNGASVSIGGKPAYVYFTSPGQINVLAPNVLPGPVSVTVTTAGGTTPTFATTASLYGPAFFPWPGNQVVATRQDYSFAVKPGTFPTATLAAKPGDVIILWANGFGPTNPVAPVGVATPSNTAYATATSPTITMNGAPVIVFGAALASGSAGLYQIAIQVPNTLADGDYTIQAGIGNVLSPPGSILSVHH